MLGCLWKELESKLLAAIARHMDNNWQPGVQPSGLPRHGLDAFDNKLTAKEIVMLAKCIIVPLTAIDAAAANAIGGTPTDGSEGCFCLVTVAVKVQVTAFCFGVPADFVIAVA